MSARPPTFGDVNVAALAACPGLLTQWFPNGRPQGQEFRVGSLEGERGQSLSINMTSGLWKDFVQRTSGR